MSETGKTLAIVLRVAALAVLLAGLFLAYRIDQSAQEAAALAAAESEAGGAPLSAQDSKRYENQMGQLTGTEGVLVGRIAEAMGSRTGAITVAILSIGIAAGGLVAADRLAKR